jgi:hypothetical protein
MAESTSNTETNRDDTSYHLQRALFHTDGARLLGFDITQHKMVLERDFPMMPDSVRKTITKGLVQLEADEADNQPEIDQHVAVLSNNPTALPDSVRKTITRRINRMQVEQDHHQKSFQESFDILNTHTGVQAPPQEAESVASVQPPQDTQHIA